MRNLKLLVISFLFVFNANSQNEPQKIKGEYEAIIKGRGGSYLVKMELNVTEQRGSIAFISFEKFKNKNGKLPSTIYFGKGGFSNKGNKASTFNVYFSKSENNEPKKNISPPWNVYITKIKEGELYIKSNDGLTGNYKLVNSSSKINGEISPLLKDQYLEGLNKNLDGQRLIVGEIKKFDGIKSERKNNNGLLLETYVQNVETLFLKEELKVVYKFDNLREFPTIENSPYVKMQSLLPYAINKYDKHLSGRLDNTLDYLPNIKRLILINQRMEEEFLVTINRNNGRMEFDVEPTEKGKIASNKWNEASNKIEEDYQERNKKIAQAIIKSEMEGGKNPSNAVLKIQYPLIVKPFSENMDKVMKNIFYGKFDKVGKIEFYDRFYNTFLTIASSYYGKYYRKNNVAYSFSLKQTTTTTYGSGASSKNTDVEDFEIWMQPRFIDNYKKSFNTNQFTGGNMMGWGSAIKSVFRKYSADSNEFKQFLENVYRYSNGLEPVSTEEELNSL